MFLKKIASIQTNNFQDVNCAEKIQNLWQEHQTEVAKAFAGGESFYAVYHDYTSNYKGDYMLSLCRLTNEDNADFDTSKHHYQQFTVDKNTPHPQGIIHTWQEIWLAEETGQLNRTYSVDFEEYQPNQSITVFIAKK